MGAKLVRSFLTDDKSNICSLYWSSSKIKRVVRSTIAAETLCLSEERGGGNVAMYINKLVSKLWFHDGKQLNIIAYTDNESLYDAVHTLKQTAHDLLRKWLNYELAI